MRVLWFTNLPTPDIANCCNLTVNYGGQTDTFDITFKFNNIDYVFLESSGAEK